MYTLGKFAIRTGRIGRPLPDPYPVFRRNRIQFRHGATSMIAGPPGRYKSVIGLNLSYKWAKDGKGVLHFAADSDEATVAKRMSAIVTGIPIDQIETDFNAGKTGKYSSALKPLETVRFVYRKLDMDGIADQAAAYEAVYGDWPDTIFIDNLIDFVERPDDWGGLLLLTKELDAFAKEARTHVCILHHTRLDENKDPGTPPKEYEIQGKITQIPRTVLTVGSRGSIITLDCVKNTNGPSGMGWMHFQVDSSFRIKDSTEHLQSQLVVA